MAQISDSTSEQVSFIVCVISITIYGTGILALLVAFYHRKYPLLKAKHLPLLALSHFGAILWNVGFLHASNFLILPARWELCGLWDIWIQWVFGVMLLSGVLILRLYSLYRVFVQRKSVTVKELVIVSIYYYLPIVLCAVFFTIMPKVGSWYNPVTKKCQVNAIYQGTAFGIVSLALIGLGWLTYNLRGIRRSFNEFKELRIGFFLVLLVFSVNAILVMTHLSQSMLNRCILAVFNVLAGNLYFWLTLGRPLYGCLFQRQQYLDKFLHTLALDGVYTEDLSSSDGGATSYGHLRRAPSYRGYTEEDSPAMAEKGGWPSKQNGTQRLSQVGMDSHMSIMNVSMPTKIAAPVPLKRIRPQEMMNKSKTPEQLSIKSGKTIDAHNEPRYETLKDHSAASKPCVNRHLSHDDMTETQRISRGWTLSPVLSSSRSTSQPSPTPWIVDDTRPTLSLHELRQILVESEMARSTESLTLYNAVPVLSKNDSCASLRRSTDVEPSRPLKAELHLNTRTGTCDTMAFSATSYRSYLTDTSRKSYEIYDVYEEEHDNNHEHCEMNRHRTATIAQQESSRNGLSPINTHRPSYESVSSPRSPRFALSPRMPVRVSMSPLMHREMAQANGCSATSLPPPPPLPLSLPALSPTTSSRGQSSSNNSSPTSYNRADIASIQRTPSAASRQQRFI
ncbi:hypothetical protein BDF19DRAFT_438530 [Syncephalis fuscata]|nr:hypothetical protein BDF19DRAFT_438530 [Syncephalis fuscata]